MVFRAVFSMRNVSVVAFVTFVSLFISACATQLSDNSLDGIANLSSVRGEMLAQVNQSRRSEGKPPLRYNAQLNAAAQAHAEDMARRGFYNHRSPEGKDVADRWRAQGGGQWQAVGENILYCNTCATPSAQARQFHERWMQSPGHRRNIMRADFEEFGFGMASAGGKIYAVQNFLTQRQPGRAW